MAIYGTCNKGMGGHAMEIIHIQIIYVEDGMILAEDLYNHKNELIVTCDTVLNLAIIEKIKQHGIFHISVYKKEDEISAKDRYEHRERIKQTEEFMAFKKDFEESINGLKKTFKKILEDSEIGAMEALLSQVSTMVRHGHSSLHVMDMMNCMREYDDVTYAHSISVALLCHLMGEWLRFSSEDTYNLAMCGLLHDIGKIQISHKIISKPGKLTKEEFDLIKEHPKLGYEILKNKNIDEHIKLSALMHHERCDGSGYPSGLVADKIDYWSKIVSIADVYDAMTADRSYRKGMCPFEVLDIWEKEGLQKYDPGLILLFMEKTAYSYINSSVRLSDGRIGEVVSIQKNNLSKPLVKVGDEFIDLVKEKDLFIKQII